MFSFNLVDQQWIPCVMAEGKRRELSLKEVFVGARNVIEIADDSPLVTASLHRLLLAILHRNCGPEGRAGPENESEWAKLWDDGHGNWNVDRIFSYFEKWHPRFDLFDAKFPFYQCPSLAQTGAGSRSTEPISIYNLVHESATYLNKATLFDHGTPISSNAISPAEATRFLLAHQCFAVGGFPGLSKPRLKGEESAKAGPLVKGAICIVMGSNLFQTLMLNLHKYNSSDAEPFEITTEDAPVWEGSEDAVAASRYPKGYLDLLTWRSRRVLLLPETDESGHTVVNSVLIRKGNEFPKGFLLYGKEPTLAFRKLEKPKQEPWVPVSFTEDRSVWRDSLALLQSVHEKRARPKMLDWLNDLVASGVLPKSSTYNIAAGGLISDTASIALWRHERLPLPLRYLEDTDLLDKLKESLDLAEKVGGYRGGLFASGFIDINTKGKKEVTPGKKEVTPFQILANEILPKDQKGNADPDEARRFVEHLAPARPYWARLGLAFNTLLLNLAEENRDKAEVLSAWAKEVGRSARRAFREATDGLDRSGRTLKAVAKAEDEFNRRLNVLLAPYKQNQEKGGD